MGMIIALPASIIIALLMLTLYFCVMTAIDELDDWLKRRRKVKELCKEYDVWYSRYLSCDNFSGAVDKGKAGAMCVVLRNMIEEMGGKRA